MIKNKKILKLWWILLVLGIVVYKILNFFISSHYLVLVFLVYFVGVFLYTVWMYDHS